jgi:signal transduction histidine kinase
LSQLLIEEIQQKNYTGVEEYAGLIHQSSQQTLNLLTNLLEWARSQTGKISFRPETIQVEEMVRDIERLLANTSSRKSITVERFIPDQLQIFADNTMIELIFRNLISNAIKFTNPQGRIEIRATEETDKIVFSVADNGIGMSTATIQKLFRIDETYSTTGTQNEYGTGLGLILCKEFVDQHRGIIWVESEEGKGSTFYFSIPRT